MANTREAIENLLTEDRVFDPPPAFAAAANAGPDIYDDAEADPEGFWDGSGS